MLDILFCSVISFFAAFGVIEFVIFLYSSAGKNTYPYFVTIPVNNKCKNIEGAVREAYLNNNRQVIIINYNYDEETDNILRRLKTKYSSLTVLTEEEYYKFLQDEAI